MTLVSYDERLAINQQPLAKPQRVSTAPAPSIWAAATRQESSVYALNDLATRTAYPPQEDFDFAVAFKNSAVAQANEEPFLVAQSDAEFKSIEARVAQEARDRNTLASGGWAGIGAGMAMGILDPTILLPGGFLGKGATALKTAANVSKWAMVGVGVQEVALQSNQELRTMEESLLNIAAGSVLAGVLGGAMGGLAKTKFDRIAADMVALPGKAPVSPTAVPPATARVGDTELQPAGAQIAPRLSEGSAGGLAPALGHVDTAVARLNPVTRNLSQKYSATVSWAQAQLDTAGTLLEGNLREIASAPGGDVLTRRKQWDGLLAKAKDAEKQFFKEYRASSGKLGKRGFNEVVGRVLADPELEVDPMVKKAADYYRNEVFIPIYKEAKALGMEGFSEISMEDAMKYFPRNVKRMLASAQRDDFVDILSQNAKQQLENTWQRKQNFVNTKADALEQKAADLKLDEAETAEVRAGLEDEMAKLPEQFGDAGEIAAEIRALKADARIAETAEERALLNAEADLLKEQHADALKPFAKAEKGLKSRFQNLDQTKAGLANKQKAILAKIEDVEGQQLATLERAQRQVQRLLNKIDSMSDDAIEAELGKIQDQIDKADAVFERGQARLAKLEDVPDDFRHLADDDVRSSEAASKEQARQVQRAERSEALRAKLDDAIDGKVSAREVLEETLEELNKRTLRVNNKRAVRLEGLRARARAADPAGAAIESAKLSARAADVRSDFFEAAREQGGSSARAGDDLDFAKAARNIGENVASKMLGENTRHSYMSLLGERGSEIARTLHIDPTAPWTMADGRVRTYGEFLEHDIEKAATTYVRTMGPDMELFRKFGTVEPLEVNGKLLGEIREDFAKARVEASKKFEGKALEKEQNRIAKGMADTERDLRAVIDRIRHVRGQPDDPMGVAFRAGRVMANLNVTRMMGSVVISSIPDIGRLIMEHGLTRTFRDGFIPLVTDFKNVKMNLKELQAAGTALDLSIHGRSQALFDAFDEYEYGTLGERYLQQATNKFGLISGFDHWNVAMKTFAGNVTMARLQDSLQTVVEGTGSAKAQRNANKFLAKHNLGSNEVRKIWAQLQLEGGSNNYRGVLLPNTESWTDVDAQRAYRAALAQNVDNTIITPGTELPLWTDANQLARLFAQFRSFTFSSTSKILLSGAQDLKQGDMAPLIGSVFSMGLGAFSYYTWAMTRGGATQKRMENASPAEFAAEAFSRSGLTGVFADLYDAAERTPLTGAEKASAFMTGPVKGAVLGPTFSGAVDAADTAIKGLSSDGMSDSSKRAAWRLAPYNNLWWLRAGLSAVDKMGSDVPQDLGLLR